LLQDKVVIQAVIDLTLLLNELALKNWAMNMHFNPIRVLQGLFAGGATRNASPSPQLYLDSDPPAFIGVTSRP